MEPVEDNLSVTALLDFAMHLEGDNPVVRDFIAEALNTSSSDE